MRLCFWASMHPLARCWAPIALVNRAVPEVAPPKAPIAPGNRWRIGGWKKGAGNHGRYVPGAGNSHWLSMLSPEKAMEGQLKEREERKEGCGVSEGKPSDTKLDAKRVVGWSEDPGSAFQLI